MKSKKGISALAATILVLSLLLVFAVFAYSLQFNMWQKITETVSSSALSKVNVDAIPILKLIKEKFPQEKELTAKIILSPQPPACPDEYISLTAANATTLPENITWTYLRCKWDLDTSKDTNGDKVPDNDADSTNCTTHTSLGYSANTTTVKLRLMVTSDAPNDAGTYSDATAIINATANCACSKGLCLGSLDMWLLIGQQVNNGNVITLKLPKKYLGLVDLEAKGVHFKILVNDGTSLKNNDLRLDVGNDGISDYVLKLPEDTTSIGGIITVDGQNLASSINKRLAICQTDTCEIPIAWYTTHSLTIEDIHIPMQPKVAA